LLLFAFNVKGTGNSFDEPTHAQRYCSSFVHASSFISTIDLKHIAQGEKCRMDKDAIIARMGTGAPGTVRVRYAAQISGRE
jgi:hypothetical protein